MVQGISVLGTHRVDLSVPLASSSGYRVWKQTDFLTTGKATNIGQASFGPESYLEISSSTRIIKILPRGLIRLFVLSLLFPWM